MTLAAPRPATALPPLERTLTQLDLLRLSRLDPRGLPPALAECLDTADVVDHTDIAPDVVTMNAECRVQDLATGAQHTVRLCYPVDADPAAGRWSVLSPAGAGLLGVRSGGTAHWRDLQGRAHAVQVLEVLYQPEAAGDFTR